MVAPDTDTGAPAASDRTFCASSRRLPIFGRGPTTCTATLPMVKPAVAHDPGGLGQQRDAGGAGPLGAPGAEVLPEVAEAGRGEQRVAGGVRDDVGVGVAGQARALALPLQARAPQLAALLEGVDVGADADLRQHR